MTALPGEVTTSVIECRSELQALSASWDTLAVSSSRPYCAPGWMLSWWDHVRPEGSRLHSIAVWQGDQLVGLLPLCLTRDRWGIGTGHLLGHDTSSYSEPLAFHRLQHEVAAATVSSARARNGLDVLALTGVPQDSPWPRLLQQAWPGPPARLVPVSTMQAPLVDIPPGGYDEWFAGKSRNFRQQARSRSREFVRRGGCFVPADSEAEMIDALRDFQRLHLSRWSSRGGSQALRPGVLEMLEQASVELGPDRMQIWTAQVDGTAVASALFVGAGHELHYWLGGFDEEWAALSLSLLLLVEAVRHAAAKGYHRVSFGPGAQDYKYRLATGEDRLDWLDLLPVGRRYPYVRAIQLPSRLRQFAVRRTPPEVKQRIRSGVGRVLGRDRPAESGSDG